MILNIRILWYWILQTYIRIHKKRKNELNQLQDAEDHNRAFQGGRAASSWWICGIRAETWVYRNKDELFFRFLHSVLVFFFLSSLWLPFVSLFVGFQRLPFVFTELEHSTVQPIYIFHLTWRTKVLFWLIPIIPIHTIPSVSLPSCSPGAACDAASATATWSFGKQLQKAPKNQITVSTSLDTSTLAEHGRTNTATSTLLIFALACRGEQEQTLTDRRTFKVEQAGHGQTLSLQPSFRHEAFIIFAHGS